MVWLFHLLNKGNQVIFIIISCLGHANMRAFYENPNRIHTELAFILPLSKMHVLSSTKIFKASKTNSVDPDQTAPVGAV